MFSLANSAFVANLRQSVIKVVCQLHCRVSAHTCLLLVLCRYQRQAGEVVGVGAGEAWRVAFQAAAQHGVSQVCMHHPHALCHAVVPARLTVAVATCLHAHAAL